MNQVRLMREVELSFTIYSLSKMFLIDDLNVSVNESHSNGVSYVLIILPGSNGFSSSPSFSFKFAALI